MSYVVRYKLIQFDVCYLHGRLRPLDLTSRIYLRYHLHIGQLTNTLPYGYESPFRGVVLFTGVLGGNLMSHQN